MRRRDCGARAALAVVPSYPPPPSSYRVTCTIIAWSAPSLFYRALYLCVYRPETVSLDGFNPRRCLRCRTRFKTAIAAARPFLGLCPSPLLWLKALDALYNFPAAGKVVGGKPGAR